MKHFNRASPLLFALVSQTACTELDGLKPQDVPDAARDSFAAPDAALDADGDGACARVTPPLAPTFVAPPGGLEFTVAVSQVDLGESDEGTSTERFRAMGFDLDLTCTGQGEGSSCVRPSWATADASDGPGGRDNAFGLRLQTTYLLTGESATAVANALIQNGTITTVIRVRKYNGSGVDNEVEVALFGATRDPEGGNPPKWDGQDEWAAHLPWLILDDGDGGTPSVERPKYYDANAYVTAGMLVAKLDHFIVGAAQPLDQMVMTARIVAPDGGKSWSLEEGTIAGRTPVNGVLANLDLLNDTDTRQPLCTNAPSYLTFKQAICATADIVAEGPDEPSRACDAASWAWNFKAEKAVLNGVDPLVIRHECEEPVSPANDRCETLE